MQKAAAEGILCADCLLAGNGARAGTAALLYLCAAYAGADGRSIGCALRSIAAKRYKIVLPSFYEKDAYILLFDLKLNRAVGCFLYEKIFAHEISDAKIACRVNGADSRQNLESIFFNVVDGLDMESELETLYQYASYSPCARGRNIVKC